MGSFSIFQATVNFPLSSAGDLSQQHQSKNFGNAGNRTRSSWVTERERHCCAMPPPWVQKKFIVWTPRVRFEQWWMRHRKHSSGVYQSSSRAFDFQTIGKEIADLKKKNVFPKRISSQMLPLETESHTGFIFIDILVSEIVLWFNAS